MNKNYYRIKLVKNTVLAEKCSNENLAGSTNQTIINKYFYLITSIRVYFINYKSNFEPY